MPQNEKLQSLLHYTRLVCLVKMDAVNNTLTEERADIQYLHSNYEKLFGHFYNPKLWEKTIPFERKTLTALVLKVDTIDPGDHNAYLDHSQKLLDFLKDDLLEDAFKRLAATRTWMWNLRMLNALRITLQQEDDRIAFFKAQGEDLDNDPKFQALSTEQKALVRVFRELLTTNGIKSNAEKVDNMKTRGNLIAQTDKLSVFLRLYEKLNAFIKEQVEEAIQLPEPVDPPSELNQRALNVLIPILLRIEQKLDFFESEGVDLDGHVGYQTEAGRHPQLLISYRSALEGNTIESTEADIVQLQQLRKGIAEANEIDAFVAQFKQLNNFMENAIAGLS